MSNVTRTPSKNLTVKSIFLNTASIGNNIIIAGQLEFAIRVISAVVIAGAANTVFFTSNGNPISASFPLGANGGMVMSFNEHGWFQTVDGQSLGINLGSAVATAIQLNYIIL